MNRLLFTTLAFTIVVSSGCSTVRGKQTSYLTSPCLSQQKLESRVNNYSPTPQFDNDVHDPLPVIELDEEIPPPPPATLDTSAFNPRPIRKPVYPPMQGIAVSWSQSVIKKFRN
ncbi:hypothetical protein OAF98_00385 [Planctomicrobium sp.]|nr:hypothetical protein [Planctomicrobium sp.]MDB4742914.1 hypothetical protein [Planctomicrobium sp.]